MSSDGSSRLHLWRVYAVAGLATLIWSINYIFAKHALSEFPPMLVSSIRTAFAAFLIVPVYAWHMRGTERPRSTPRQVLLMSALGVFGIGLNQVFFVLGIHRTSVSHAAIIVGLTPLLVLLIATVFRQEHMRKAQLAGMLLAFVGVIVLQLSSGDQRGSSLTGDLLVFCGCSMFALFTVCSKSETRRMGPIVLNTFAYIASAIALLPVTVWYSGFEYGNVTWMGWASLFYMAAFSSVIGYLLFSYALSHIPASRISTFAYLQPVVVMFLAMIFLGERPTASLYSGGALVLAGVFFAERT